MKTLAMNRDVDLRAGVAPAGVMPSDKPRRFQIEAYDGGPLPVAGFEYPVIVNLASLECPASMPLLIDHTATVEATLGSTDIIENNGQTLNISGLVTATSQMALNVVAQSDKGQRWQASIGVRVGRIQEIAAGQIIAVNGQQFRGPVLVAHESQMYETSVLPAGADWTTTVNLAARAALLKGSAIMPTFEEWLASIGVDPAKLNGPSAAAFQQTYDAMQNPAPEAPMPAAAPPVAAAPVPVAQPVNPAQIAAKMGDDLTAALRARHAKEIERITAIESVTTAWPSIRATAIKDNWEPIKAENAVLREENKISKGPRSAGGSKSTELTGQVLEAAVCMTRKIPGHEKQYSDQTLQAAHDQFKHGIGLQQLFLTAAAQNGYNVGHGERVGTSNLRAVLRAAFPTDINAAFSTVSLPGIFSNIANKELLAGYIEEDTTWKEVATIKSVSDFKTVTSYRMLDDMEYEQLGPAGQIKHGTLSEESYTRQANTFAKMFVLTRTDIINDDMSALDDLRNRIGRGAGKKLNKVFWTEFLSDASTFWTTARTNYITGATSNLGSDGVGLGLGVTAFRKMTSPTADGSKKLNAGNGEPGNVRNGAGGRPEILLVPPELESIAETLYRNTNIGAVANSSANIYANKYKPVVVWQLSDSAYTNYSTTAWYLLNSPGYLAPISVSFLNGSESPTVESAEADFNTLGVQFRGYHDFGCDQAEYLAGVKSKGAA